MFYQFLLKSTFKRRHAIPYQSFRKSCCSVTFYVAFFVSENVMKNEVINGTKLITYRPKHCVNSNEILKTKSDKDAYSDI